MDFLQPYLTWFYICVCMSELAVSLAEPQCQAEWSGRHGSSAEDCRVGDRREPQKTIYGRLHLCTIFRDEIICITLNLLYLV